MKTLTVALALLFAIPVNAQPAYESVVLSDSPAAYWPLNDPAMTVNPGERVNGLYTFPVWDAPTGLGAPGLPVGGTSWSYNGPDVEDFRFAPYWRTEHHPAIDIGGGSNFTLEAWFKHAVPISWGPSYMVTKVPAYGPDWWVHPWAGGGYGLVTSYVGGPYRGWSLASGVYGGGAVAVGTTLQSASEWHHLVTTQVGTTLYIYVNGVLEGQEAVTNGALNSNGGPLFIGSSTHYLYFCITDPSCTFHTNPPFHGSLAHVAVYKHALSPERIAVHYDAGMNGDVVGLGSTPEPKPVVAPAPRDGKTYDVQGRRVDPAARSGVTFGQRKRVGIK